MSMLDTLTEQHGLMKKPRGPFFNEFPEEPEDHFVRAPARGKGTAFPGTVVEDAYIEMLKEFTLKWKHVYKTNQDVTRAALYYFINKIIIPGMTTQAADRVRGLAVMDHLKNLRKYKNDDARMMEDCAELWSSASCLSERQEPLEALYAYIGGILIPDRQEELIDKCQAHPVFGEAFTKYRAYVKSKPIEGQEPYLDEVG